ncbi:MAG: ATP-binding cassette domain-containing protein, partial [Candidatus Atribacteria bacterium]
MWDTACSRRCHPGHSARRIYGVVGPSGAGKTTLIRMLSGLAIPTAGTAKVLGSLMPFERRAVEHRFGYMPQER